MNEVYLLTGGNMGDRKKNLSIARDAIQEKCGPVSQHSSLYETAAWGKEDQPSFLNQVLKISTELSPRLLLQELLAIEKKMGRMRETKYGPRMIDIDILLYGEQTWNEPGLTIPHPQMQFRRFVLEPLAEIAGKKKHPVLRKTIRELLADCTDPLAVNKIS